MVQINPGFTIKDDEQIISFWDLNPQLIIRSPYAKLYERDKSKDKNVSSSEMWTIFFMCYPDESKNTFYSLPYEQRIDALQYRIAKDIDFDEALFKLCMEHFPFDCLSAVERSLKEEIDSLMKRSRFIADFDYEGKSMAEIKNFDTMRAQTPKIYDNYEMVQAKFTKEKQVLRAKGGAVVSKGQMQKW